MIYLFNSSSIPWEYKEANENFSNIVSSRTNKKQKNSETTTIVGLSLLSDVNIDTEKLANCVNMVDTDSFNGMAVECEMICAEETYVRYRHKDLRGYVSIFKDGHRKMNNIDVILASIPLSNGVVKRIQGANILGYKIVASEFVVAFVPKYNDGAYETPVFTINNKSEGFEYDVSFVANEVGGYTCCVAMFDISGSTEPVNIAKIRLYRPCITTKLIFVRSCDMRAFNKIFGDRYARNFVVEVDDNTIDEEITKYIDNEKYKACTIFVNAKHKNNVDMNDSVIDTITKKFAYVNLLTSTKYVSILK